MAVAAVRIDGDGAGSGGAGEAGLSRALVSRGLAALERAALARRRDDATVFADLSAARAEVMTAVEGGAGLGLDRALRVLGVGSVAEIEALARGGGDLVALASAGLTLAQAQAGVGGGVRAVVLDRDVGGAAGRRTPDVVSLLARRGRWPVERVLAARAYEADYQAWVRAAGVGMKLMRLERFVGGVVGSVEAARVAEIVRRERMAADQAAVVEVAGAEALQALNRVVGEGADIDTAMKDPVLAPIVRGSRGSRPRARLVASVAAALDVLVARRTGPSSEAKTLYGQQSRGA